MANVWTRRFRRVSDEQRGMDAWFNFDPDPQPGRLIDASRATRLTAVYAAIRHIVDYISTLPLDAYRMSADGTRSDMALPQLFKNQDAAGAPGLGQWIGQAVYGMAVHGQAVGFVTDIDGFGYPTSVRWIAKHDWSFDEANKQWYLSGQPVPTDRIVHVPWIVPAGHTIALSPIEVYASMVRAGLSAQEYADIRRGGGIPPTHLKNTAQVLSPEQSEIAAKRAGAAFAAGKPLVTGSDWDFSPVQIPPNHTQFIETLKLTANQIAAIYGIEATEIGGQAANSLEYKTEELREMRRASDMRPYIVRLEQAFSRILPPMQFVKLNIDSTIRTDIKTRFEIYLLERQMGTRSVNEIRALEDRPPVDGGDSFEPMAQQVKVPGPNPNEGEPS